MGFSIRPMKETDAAVVCRLSGYLGYELDIGQFFGRFSMLNEDPNHTVWVMDSPETGVVAWLHLGLIHTTRLEVKALVVDEKHQKAGLGKRFMAYAESFARTEGFLQVFLTSSIKRADAHAFYERLGYVRTQTSHKYLKNI